MSWLMTVPKTCVPAGMSMFWGTSRGELADGMRSKCNTTNRASSTFEPGSAYITLNESTL